MKQHNDFVYMPYILYLRSGKESVRYREIRKVVGCINGCLLGYDVPTDKKCLECYKKEMEKKR